MSRENLRPYQHLPLPFPAEYDPSEIEPDYFYQNFLRHFIPDMIQMMDTGLHIDEKAVEELRQTIDNVLATVQERLSKNSLIQQYQESILPAAQKAHAEKATQAVRDVAFYLKEFDDKNIIHRTWVVNTYLKTLRKEKDKKEKWSLKDLKGYNLYLSDPFLQALVEKRSLKNNKHVKEGMLALAEYRTELWNYARYEKAKEPVKLEPFNAGSAKQKQELFEMLGIEALATSKDTGQPSWGRDQLEELKLQTNDQELLEVLDALIDFSYSAIIKNNFLKAFDAFTVDGVLHGNIKLFGAKSCRNTCLVGNTLVQSSSGLVPIKELKPEMLVLTVDGSLQKILNVFDNGLAPVFKITLKDGKSITGTSNHQFLTESGYLSIEDICNVESSQRSTETRRANPSALEGKPYMVSCGYGKSFKPQKRTDTQNSPLSCGTKSNYRTKKTKSFTENPSFTAEVRAFNTEGFSIPRASQYREYCRKTQNQPKISKSGTKQKFHQKGNSSKIQAVFQQGQSDNQRKTAGISQRDEKISYLYERQEWLSDNAETCVVRKERPNSICASSSDVRSPRNDQTTSQFCSSSHKWGQDRQSYRKPFSADKRSTFKTASGSSPIQSIEYVGIARVYDVEVETNHCYLANGIWSHNSNSPNLLNAPSTGSIYAKPLKRCFVAPKKFIVYTADLNGLEDRCIANLSGDTNKQAIFLENLDGHSLAATYYFKQHLTAIIGEYTNHKDASRLLAALVEEENKIAKAIRQDGKPGTFGLSYGAYPPKLAQTLKCPLEEAEHIFNAYHHELYPGITRYREDYVLKTARQQGYIHLGLGCRMYTSDADKAIRTLANATVQFWSILTLIAINELNHRIRLENLTKEIQVTSTIYDSIYTQCIADAEIISWLNKTMIELMTVQYLENEVIHNEAAGELGLNWADLHKVPNNASPSEIQAILDTL